jgi:hypothetical protein
MKPKTGGRVVLDLAPHSGDTVVYTATLYVPDAEWSGRATIDAAGSVAFAPWAGPAAEPPAWLVHYAQTFLRSAYREAKKDIPYPAQINRWRDER